MTRAAFLLLLLAVIAPARADTYRMDIIVFRNLWAGDTTEHPPPAHATDLRGAIEPTDVEALTRDRKSVV